MTDNSMSSTQPNTALRALVAIGVILLGGGAIWAYAAARKAEYDADVQGLTRAMMADSGQFIGRWQDVTVNYTTAWIAGAVAAIGLLMLVAALVVKAARPR